MQSSATELASLQSHCFRPFHKPVVPMDYMRRVAYETVLRACGFASLAIFCFMVGLSFAPRVAFQSGGVLTMVMTGVLFLKAYWARTKPYRHTEMWLYLPTEHRPPPSSAQQITGTLMRETYLTFALWTSMVAIAMWAIAFAFALAGL
jgi:hypothetical protein